MLDFGISKAPAAEDLTQAGQIIGTPQYLSPEQIDGTVGPESDRYALGVLMYMSLTDDFPTRAISEPAPLPRDRGGRFDPPRKLRPTCPRASKRSCCARCTAAQRGASNRSTPRAAAVGVRQPARPVPMEDVLPPNAGRGGCRRMPGDCHKSREASRSADSTAWHLHDSVRRIDSTASLVRTGQPLRPAAVGPEPLRGHEDGSRVGCRPRRRACRTRTSQAKALSATPATRSAAAGRGVSHGGWLATRPRGGRGCQPGGPACLADKSALPARSGGCRLRARSRGARPFGRSRAGSRPAPPAPAATKEESPPPKRRLFQKRREESTQPIAPWRRRWTSTGSGFQPNETRSLLDCWRRPCWARRAARRGTNTTGCRRSGSRRRRWTRTRTVTSPSRPPSSPTWSCRSSCAETGPPS